MREPSTHFRGTTSVVAFATARRAVRSGAVWGLLFGVLVANEAIGYHSSFSTVSSRTQFAQTFRSNAGLTAVTGPARELATIEGFVAWRMMALMSIAGAMWGLLTATRLLRGEEDAGRWELFVSGRTTRRRATAQALGGLAAGLLSMWALTAAGTVFAGLRPSVGFPVTASLFYATAGVSGAAMFLAIGALCSQLTTTRRQANGLGAAVFGLSYVIRMVADGSVDLGWLRWASPLGWVENLAPLTQPQPAALVPIVLLVAVSAAASVFLAGRRDVGVGALGRQQPARPHWWLPSSPVGLAARLERWVVCSWVVGLAVLAAVFGAVARAASEGGLGDQSVGQVVGTASGAAAWVGYEFLYLAAILAFAAANQISAIRDEEAGGQLDNLLARTVGRPTWLVERLGLACGLVLTAGLAMGIAGWFGVGRGGGADLADMLAAGLNTAVPGFVVVGLGTLLYGAVPRMAVPILYALILWSFLVEIIGSTLTTSRLLLDTSVLSHLGPVPATAIDWSVVASMISFAVVAGALGVMAFTRRDLAGA